MIFKIVPNQSSVKKVRASGQALLNAMGLFAIAIVAALIAATANAQIGRESVGRLFFSFEERNVLEAVRQGVVDTGAIPTIGSEIFIPEVALPEITFAPQIQMEGNRFSRGFDLVYQGLIRRRLPDGSVDGNVIVNGRLLDDEQLTAYRDDLGLYFRTDRDDGGIMYAEDKLFNNNVALTRGSIIKSDGEVISSGSGLSDLRRFIVVKRDI